MQGGLRDGAKDIKHELSVNSDFSCRRLGHFKNVKEAKQAAQCHFHKFFLDLFTGGVDNFEQIFEG